MFIHMFAFRWKPEASQAQKDRALADIQAFQGQIAGRRARPFRLAAFANFSRPWHLAINPFPSEGPSVRQGLAATRVPNAGCVRPIGRKATSPVKRCAQPAATRGGSPGAKRGWLAAGRVPLPLPRR